jgi:hypothetical protein
MLSVVELEAFLQAKLSGLLQMYKLKAIDDYNKGK